MLKIKEIILNLLRKNIIPSSIDLLVGAAVVVAIVVVIAKSPSFKVL